MAKTTQTITECRWIAKPHCALCRLLTSGGPRVWEQQFVQPAQISTEKYRVHWPVNKLLPRKTIARVAETRCSKMSLQNSCGVAFALLKNRASQVQQC
jgi:hypothetical protein